MEERDGGARAGVKLTYQSKHGEEEYPGNLNVNSDAQFWRCCCQLHSVAVRRSRSRRGTCSLQTTSCLSTTMQRPTGCACTEPACAAYAAPSRLIIAIAADARQPHQPRVLEPDGWLQGRRWRACVCLHALRCTGQCLTRSAWRCRCCSCIARATCLWMKPRCPSPLRAWPRLCDDSAAHAHPDPNRRAAACGWHRL